MARRADDEGWHDQVAVAEPFGLEVSAVTAAGEPSELLGPTPMTPRPPYEDNHYRLAEFKLSALVVSGRYDEMTPALLVSG